MPTKPKTNSITDNPVVQKYIDQIDTDAQAALDTADKVLKSETGKLYSSSTYSSYSGDRKRLDKCWGDFNAAWNSVVFGKAKDNKALIKTYTKYVLALEILEQANIRHEAVMTSRLAILIALLCKVLTRVIAAKKKRLEDLRKELEAVKALLEKAQRDVTEAKAQLVLNGAVTAVSFCLGPVGWGARIGVAVGGMAVHAIIDASLGPSSGSVEGSINTVAGESVELADKLSKGTKRLGGAASAVLTLGMDVGEIGQAQDIVKQVQKQLPKVLGKYRALAKESKGWANDLEKAAAGYSSALKTYQTAAKKAARSDKSRKELLKEFKQWK